MNNFPFPLPPTAFLTASPIIAFKEAQFFFKEIIKKEHQFFVQLSCSSSFFPALSAQGYSKFMGLLLMEEAGSLLLSHRVGKNSISCY